MLSVEDITKAPQARLNLPGGPTKSHGEQQEPTVQEEDGGDPEGAVEQRPRVLLWPAPSYVPVWGGPINGETQMTIQCTRWLL